MSFNSLGLSEALLKAIDKQGYTTPSPIQQKAIPLILEGKDVLASAQTGTGKTAGFTLPMLQKLSQGQQLSKRPIRALVLTPTRELAAQVHNNVKSSRTLRFWLIRSLLEELTNDHKWQPLEMELIY
jgi:ATP-dependent RNA helicase RhlE